MTPNKELAGGRAKKNRAPLKRSVKNMLFDQYKRIDISPKRNNENEFEFLNRSARPEISRVREFVESLVKTYPESETEELIARIRSGNDAHFKSATFELILHEFLIKMRCSLLPHPKLENGIASRPDFLVTTPDGEQFYLEAVLASERNNTDQGSEAMKGIVWDALSAVSHKNFLVDIKAKGDPATQPSSKKLVRAVLRWLDSLDPDEIQKIIDHEGYKAAPSFQWEHEDWIINFRAKPLRPGRRGESKSLIRTLGIGGGFTDAWSPIRDAVKSKGRKYGELIKPLLVAVNLDSFKLDRIDEMQALYGQEQLVSTVGPPDREPRFERAPNGAWYGKSGPQYTRVSGLWIFNDLSPYTIGVRHQTIYLNPWAKFFLPEFLKALPHASLNEAKMEWTDGVRLANVFELEKGWPELNHC